MFEGHKELKKFVLNNNNPCFLTFINIYLEQIVSWSIKLSHLNGEDLYSTWKQRFALEMKNCNKLAIIHNSKLTYDKKNGIQ
ncbi:unnamed protein product [Cunninghamella blakesleeana]